jgi:NAD-dependent deacetylase
MLVIGTSGSVYPAALLPHIAKERGSIIIEINPEETELSDIADIKIRAKSGEALPKILERIKKLLQ